MWASVLVFLTLPKDYTRDLTELLRVLESEGAYVREDGIDFARLRRIYGPVFAQAKDDKDALRALERVVDELHDNHASLRTNDDRSPRLVPSGTDLILHESRGGFSTSYRKAGTRATAIPEKGVWVTHINGRLIEDLMRERLGGLYPTENISSWPTVVSPNVPARIVKWAANAVIAGHWNQPRVLGFSDGTTFDLGTYKPPKHDRRLTVTDQNGILTLRPEDCLYDDALIRDFDELVPRMRRAKRIVLDLRNTPSGGNTTVARGIMGLFIGKRMPYQRHQVTERSTGTVRDWVEYATPRLTTPVRTPLEVHVGPWTASMGEGLAIGFDGLKRAQVFGPRMAGLRGAISEFELPVTGFRIAFPTEKLFHVGGTPRHEWLPRIRFWESY
jgi:hypothetical protein